MTISDVTIRILFLMLPGIISARIIEHLTVHKAWKQFRFVINSFLLGVINYSILSLIDKYWCCGHRKVQFWAALFDKCVLINMYEIFYASLIALVVGFILSKAIQEKWIHKLARRLKVSEKYGDENLFSYFLNSQEIGWVFVRDFKNNLSYLGYRTSFSENDDIQEIVLANVTVYSFDETLESTELYQLPLIYLSYKIGEIVIELPQTQAQGA